MPEEYRHVREDQSSTAPQPYYREPPVEEDEISLVDLFVVLLRYRKLILGIVVLSIILAGVGYWYFPQKQYQSALENQKIEAVLSFSAAPVVELLGLQGQISSTITQPPILLEALQEAGFESFGYGDPQVFDENTVDITDPQNRSQALYLVRRKLIEDKKTSGEKYDSEGRVFFVNKSDSTVELIFRHDDRQKAKAFLNAVYRLAADRYLEMIRPKAENIASSYERLLQIENPNQGVQNSIDTGRQRYDAAKRLLAGEENIFIKLGEPYIFDREITIDDFRSNFKVKAVVLVVAGFFLAVFLAFVLNAMRNVKSDEESMEKIREALGKEPKEHEDPNSSERLKSPERQESGGRRSLDERGRR